MKDIIQIKNAFSPTLYTHIKANLEYGEFPWSYLSSSSYSDSHKSYEADASKHIPSFANVIFMNGREYHRISQKIEAGFLCMLDNLDLKIKDLLRIRIGMQIGNHLADDWIVNSPHIDGESPHKTALIYLTTCNAPTVFYNTVFDPSCEMSSYEFYSQNRKKFKSWKEIQSVENCAVLFDGLRYHSSTIPNDVSRRIVININFTLQ